MESDNYIDSLSVSLNLPSEYSPSKAQEEADSIVDQYVIPAVESVVEEMGQEMEARIPLVEIDVGRVRLQDLRDAIESSLRNALDRYRSSEFVEAESSVENVKDFAETGLAPWENGDVPFNPFLFLKDNLKKDSDAIRDSLVTFSEKELVSLLMATFQNTTSSSEVSPVLQLQDAVFDRLSLGFPETASALTARLSSWRRYRSIPEKRLSTTLGNVPYDNEPLNVSVPALQTDTLSESVITSSDEPDRESAPSPSRSVFKYVEISMRDVPEGHSVEVSNYVGIPDAHSPEYIMVLGNPNRYYRKVATDTMENRILSPADGANGAGTGLSGRETEIRPMRDQEDTEPVGSNDTESVIPSSAEPDRESVPSPSRSVFKYVEISMRDIPEGHSVEVSDYVGISDVHSPAYIMVLGNPNRFFRKVATDTMGNSILSPTDDAIGAGTDLSERETRINPMRDQEDAEAVGSANTNSVISSSAEPDREPVPSPSRLVFKYVEISMRDIPEGNSIELGDYREDPTDNDPEFIMTFGHPTKFFKKVAVETKTVSSLQSESEQAWPDTGVFISDNYDNRNAQESPDVWTPRDFESEVTDARIPVSDAGLVLLHPFMARMMENLGLVEKGTFVSHLARVRAVHLLRDLTGSEEPHHNHNLILEKILCGLPVGYALPPEWEPTDREKEETEALLQAVCDYWKPLSGSSTAALCGGFILRPGTIERFEESWTIRVEGRTIDILMDDLPWEISVIFLPWLGKPIGVEWQQE